MVGGCATSRRDRLQVGLPILRQSMTFAVAVPII